MAIDTTIRRWPAPPGADAHTQKLSQALNQIEGLHSAVVPHDVQFQSQDRCIWLGPMSTPTGVVISIAPGAVLVTM